MKITTLKRHEHCYRLTAWKVSKYGVISGPNKRKYGPEITPYLDPFHSVIVIFGH